MPSPASSRSAAAAAPPAACSAASNELGGGDRVDVDHPAARRAQNASIASMCSAVWTRSELLAGRRRRLDRLEPAASRSRSSAASIATSRPAFSGCAPGVVAVRGGVREEKRHRRPRVPYPARGPSPSAQRSMRGRRRRRRPARRARGGGARGPGRRWSRASRSPRARASGPRAGSRRRWPPDDSPERHAADTLDAGRGLCRTGAVEVLTREAPAAVEQLMSRGVRFDTDPDGELALGLEGGHSARRIVHAGGSETGRAITSRLAELVAAEERDRGARGASARSPCGATASAATGCSPTPARSPRAATVLATGGGAALWARTTNPWGAIGAGSVLAHAAGRRARRPRALPVPSHRAGAARRRARRRPDHRGGPRRGRDPARRRRAAVHRRARPARPGHRRDPRPDRRRRLRPRAARPARHRPARGSRTCSRSAARPGSTPSASRSRSPPPPTT